MAGICKLTVNSTVYDSDRFAIYDSSNRANRAITAKTLKDYISKSGYDPDAFVAGRIEAGQLIMTNRRGDDVVIGEVEIKDLLKTTFNSITDRDSYFSNQFPRLVKNDVILIHNQSAVELQIWTGENEPSVYNPAFWALSSFKTSDNSIEFGTGSKIGNAGHGFSVETARNEKGYILQSNITDQGSENLSYFYFPEAVTKLEVFESTAFDFTGTATTDGDTVTFPEIESTLNTYTTAFYVKVSKTGTMHLKGESPSGSLVDKVIEITQLGEVKIEIEGTLSVPGDKTTFSISGVELEPTDSGVPYLAVDILMYGEKRNIDARDLPIETLANVPTLEAGKFLAVSDDGQSIVYKSASSTDGNISIENDGNDLGEASTVNFEGGLYSSVSNEKAEVYPVLKAENITSAVTLTKLDNTTSYTLDNQSIKDIIKLPAIDGLADGWYIIAVCEESHTHSYHVVDNDDNVVALLEGNDRKRVFVKAGNWEIEPLNYSINIKNNDTSLGSPTHLNFGDGLVAQVDDNQINVINKASALYFNDKKHVTTVNDGIAIESSDPGGSAQYIRLNDIFLKTTIFSNGSGTISTNASGNERPAISISPEGVVTFPQNPTPVRSPVSGLKFIELGSEYNDFSNEDWSTVVADFAPNDDMAYFFFQGRGSDFNGLPASLELDADGIYYIVTEVINGPQGVGFGQRLSLTSSTDDKNTNRTIQRGGTTFTDAVDNWSIASLTKDQITYDQDESLKIRSIIAGDNLNGSIDQQGNLTLSAFGGGQSPVTREEFDELRDKVLINEDRILKLIDGTVILESFELDDLGLTEEMFNTAPTRADKCQLFHSALYKSSSPNYTYYAFIDDGDDFFELLPNTTGGMFQVISYGQGGSRYTIIQFKDRSGVTRTASINSHDEFIDFGSGGSGDISREEFDEVKSTANTAHTVAITAQTEAAANTVATGANSATLVDHGVRLDSQSGRITVAETNALHADEEATRALNRANEAHTKAGTAETIANEAKAESAGAKSAVEALDGELDEVAEDVAKNLEKNEEQDTRLDGIENQNALFVDEFTAIGEKQTEQDAAIESNADNISGVNTKVTNLEESVAGQNSKITTVEELAGKASTDAAEAKAEVGGLQSQIDTINGQQTTQNTNIQTNKELAEKAVQDSTENKSKIAEIEETVGEVEADISAIKSEQTTQNTNIETNKQLSEKASQDATSNKLKIDEIEEAQGEQATELETLKNGVGNLDESVNSLLNEMAETLKEHEDIVVSDIDYTGDFDAISDATRTNPKHTFKIDGVEVANLDGSGLDFGSNKLASYDDRLELQIGDTGILKAYNDHVSVEMRDSVGNKDVINNEYLQSQIAGGGTGAAVPITTDMAAVIGQDGTNLNDFTTDQTTFSEFFNFLRTATVNGKKTFKFGHVVNASSSIKNFVNYHDSFDGMFFFTSLADNNNYADYQDAFGKMYLSCNDEFIANASTLYWQHLDGTGVFKAFHQVSSTQETTFYAHQGDHHLDILNTGSGSTRIDSMRRDTAQNEDRIKFKNNYNESVNLMLGFDGSYLTFPVLPGQVFLAWASREYGSWCHVKFFEDKQDETTYVIGIDDFTWTTNDDPRINCKNLISALPKNTLFVGYHNGSAENNKFRVVSRGDSADPEPRITIYTIVRQGGPHATGMATTEPGSGKAYARVLDGSRGHWYVAETSNSFSLADDVPLDGMPEDQLILTGDQGIMRTAVGPDNTTVLQAIPNYNLQQMIEDAQRPKSHIFVNESVVTIDYPTDVRGKQYKPLVNVEVLATDSFISGMKATVTGGDFGGNYNSVGVVCIDEHGNWQAGGEYNAFRIDDGTNKYSVYDKRLGYWVLIETTLDHNHIGQQAGGTAINLYHDGALPQGYAEYTVFVTLDSIESEYFGRCDVDIDYYTISDGNSYFTIDFGTAKPAGIVFYK